MQILFNFISITQLISSVVSIACNIIYIKQAMCLYGHVFENISPVTVFVIGEQSGG